MISYTFVYTCDAEGCNAQEIKEIPYYWGDTIWKPGPWDFGWSNGLNGDIYCKKHKLNIEIEDVL